MCTARKHRFPYPVHSATFAPGHVRKAPQENCGNIVVTIVIVFVVSVVIVIIIIIIIIIVVVTVFRFPGFRQGSISVQWQGLLNNRPGPHTR